MSDVENAVDGVTAAPLPDEPQAAPEAPEKAKEPEQENPQESATATDAKDDDQARDEKGRFVQKRINEITRARREAERRAERQAERAEALERELEQYKAQPRQSPQTPQGVPTLEQYDYDTNAWAAAMQQYNRQQFESLLDEKEKQRTRQQAMQGFAEKAKQYAADHPEYDEHIAELDASVQFRQEVIEAIAASDHGPAVAHYLAQHLDEADRISRLPAHLAAQQIGRIEAQLSAPPVAPPVTRAPNPPPTLGGSSAVAKDLGRMTYADYKRARMKGES